MTPSDRRPGPESTLEDVRSRLIAAATQALLSSGIEIGLSQIKLSEAISATGIARATAYRALAHDEREPQDELQQAVMLGLLTRKAREESYDVAGIALQHEVAVQQHNVESSDVADRTRALRAFIRVGCEASYREVVSSRERSILMSFYGSIASQGDEVSPHRLSALRQGEQEVERLFVGIYANIAGRFGYSLRSDYTMEQFATAVVGLIEGLGVRAPVSPHLEDIARPTGPDGSIEQWTLFGVAFEGLFTAFFEPQSPESPAADLLAY
ncbi:MAG: hypothetical protein V3V01_05920 [Acidimicrobiales bacterium]